MIIWGSKGKENVIGGGSFYCPRCGSRRTYKHKSIDKYFTLYFIPLFRTSRLSEFVECTTCLTPYETGVLEFDDGRQKAINQFVEMVKQEVEAGIPMQSIYAGLVNSGATDEQANMVLAMVTNGKLNQCPQCKLVYSRVLLYCSSCGARLQEVG